MKLEFVYDWAGTVDVPDHNLIGVFAPQSLGTPPDEDAVILDGLASPIGSPPLREAVGNAQGILILADNVSRPTPVSRLLPSVLEELRAADKSDGQISFLMSLGTHRPMTDAEIDTKLGMGIRTRFVVNNHRWDDPSCMVSLGKSSTGNDIQVNRLLTQADYIIGIGNIVPHPAAGFAGGGKIVDPGCVSAETCGAFHWESVKFPAAEVVGVRDNPMIAMIDEVAERAGLRFIVNTVMDAENRIVRVVAGDPVEAHREGCRTACEVYGVSIPEPADIVICDSHPADLEMWQAIKGLCTADLCLRDGGIVIMATPCPEGASEEHPELERYGYRNFDDTDALLSTGLVSMVVGHHMVQGGRLLDRADRVVIVSNGLSPELVHSLNMVPCASVQKALDDALDSLGHDARVLFLRSAAELFPVVSGDPSRQE